jgi:hypothetical protein
MDARYFVEEIVGGLEGVSCSEGRNPYERKITPHFDNARIHNTRTALGHLEQSGFKRRRILYIVRIWPRVTSFFMVT